MIASSSYFDGYLEFIGLYVFNGCLLWDPSAFLLELANSVWDSSNSPSSSSSSESFSLMIFSTKINRGSR